MSVKLQGFDQLIKTLQTYGNKTAKAAGRKAVRAGTTVLKSAIKSEVPVDEGLLKKTIDLSVSSKGGTFRGKVGADVADLKADHESDHDRPNNIDYLVNDGHVAPDGRFVPPNGFMQRGAAKGMPAAQAKAEQVLTKAIDDMETSDQ